MFPPPFGSMFGGLGNDPFTEMDRMMNNMQRNMQQMQHQMMAAHSHAPAYAMQNQHYPQGPAYVQQAPRIEEIPHAAPSAPMPRHRASQEPIVEEPDEQGNYRPQQRARRASPNRPAARNSVSAFAAPPNNGASTYYSSYSSSSSFSSSGGPNGVTYSSSTTTRMGPGGVMETRRVVSDGTTGQHVASLTRGLAGRQQTMVASRDASGRIVREQHLQGVAPGEAPEFEQQWSSMARDRLPGYNGSMQQQQQQSQLALPQAGGSYSVQHQQHSSYGGYAQGPNGPWYS